MMMRRPPESNYFYFLFSDESDDVVKLMRNDSRLSQRFAEPHPCQMMFSSTFGTVQFTGTLIG